MAIRVECPQCHQTLEAPDEFAGRIAICPTCRTKVQIPSTPALGLPTPAPIPAGPEPKPRPAKPVERIESMISDVRAELRTINRRAGCLIVLFVVFAITALVAAIFLFDKASHSLLDQVQGAAGL